MRRCFLVLFCLVVCMLWRMPLGWAHPSQAMHVADAVQTIEGFNEFNSLASEMYKLLDTMTIDGVRLSAKTHRDLFHPILFGREVPKDLLDSVSQSYARATGVTVEKAKKILIKARSNYIRWCIELVQKRTGLPRKAAEGLAGLLQVTHLLGDADVLDNAVFKALPNFDNITNAVLDHIDNLFKGGSDDLMKQVAFQKRSIVELARLYRNNSPYEYSLALGQKLKISPWGKLIKERYGNTLASRGIYYDVKLADEMLQRCNQAYRENGWKRRERLKDDLLKKKHSLKLQEKTGIRVKNTNYLTTRRINQANAIASKEVETVVYRQGVLQHIRNASGEWVDALSVPIKQAGKGIAAGVGAGVATFVFSEGVSFVIYQTGAMTEEEFIRETEKNCATALTTGAATTVVVALGWQPAGWIVLGVGITSDFIYGIAVEEMYWVQSFDWEKDWVFAALPTEIQRRVQPFSPDPKQLSLISLPTHASLLDFVEGGQGGGGVLSVEEDDEISARGTLLSLQDDKEVQDRKSLLY